MDRQHQCRLLASVLLKDAFMRTLQASSHVGAVALMVHAKDYRARRFYEHWAFVPSPLQPLQLFLPLETIREALLALEREGMQVAGT